MGFKLKQRLNSETAFPPPIVWVSLWVVVLQSVHAHFFYTPQYDRNFQTHIAYNLAQNHGITVQSVDKNDLSQVNYLHAGNFPPAYSLLLNAVNFLISDWLLSVKILHYAAIMGLWLIYWSCMRYYLDQVSQVSWISGLFLGISFAPWGYLGTTDLLAAISLFGAMIMWGKYLADSKFLHILFALLLLGLAASLRYAYYIYIFFPFFYLLFFHWRDISCSISNPTLISIIISLAGGMLVFIPLYLVQQFLTQGSYFKWLNQEISSQYWFPDNLLLTDPFIIKSFCYVDPERLAKWLTIPTGVIVFCIWIISLMLAVIVISYAIKQKGRMKVLGRLSLLNSILTLGLLMGLSLFNSPENWSGELWTYVRESRYYLSVMLLLHMWFAKIVFDTRIHIIPGTLVRAMGILFLLYATMHISYRYYEYMSGKNMRFGPGSTYESELRWLEDYFESQAQNGHSVLFVHGDLSYANVNDYHLLATVKGFRIMSLQSFMKHPQHFSREMMVVLAVSPAEKESYQRHRTYNSLLPPLENQLVRILRNMELYQVKLCL